MKRLILLISVVFSIGTVNASHLRGGSITFDCLESGSNMGKFVFSIKLWRVCYNGAAGSPTTANIQNPLYASYGGPSYIVCSKISSADITPHCDTGSVKAQCGQSSLPVGNMAFEEILYQSAPVAIYGIPVATGSSFYYSTCCRPTATNSSSGSYYLRAVMFPYTDPLTAQVRSLGSSSTGETCYDNSPQFTEPLKYQLIAGKMNYFSIKSFDADCDSLHYEKARPMFNDTAGVTWYTGYSTQYPVPGTYFSTMNIPYILDQRTGDASFFSAQASGVFNIAHKVSSYRNGQKVSEIYNDYTMTAVKDLANDSFAAINQEPSISFKGVNASSYSSTYSDTYAVGDSVHLSIRAIDNDLVSTGLNQSVTVRMISDPSISGLFNPFGCTSSSCAYLDTSSSSWTGSEFKKQSQVDVDFKWQITCDNLNKCMSYNDGKQPDTVVYYFSVVATDNLCPLPLTEIASFSIVIVDTIEKEASLKCLTFSDTSLVVSWAKHKSAGFTTYSVYSADSINGPFILLSTISNINDTTYTDNNALAIVKNKYYRVVSDGSASCNKQGNTASSVVLTVYDTLSYASELQWNGLYHASSLNSLSNYHLAEADTGGGWFVIDSIYGSSDTINAVDLINICHPAIAYRIKSFDQYGICYTSNVDSAIYDFPISYDSLSICSGDSIMLGGKYRNSSGIYMDTLNTYQGCDSVVEINLTVDSILTSTLNPQICHGDSLLIDGTYRYVSGTYTELHQSSFGCDSLVSANLTVKKVDTAVTSNGRSITARANNALYQWIECATFAGSPSDTTKTYTPTMNGNYMVVLIQNGCIDTSACINIQTVGLIDVNSTNEVLLYPNPADNSISFVFDEVFKENTSLVVFDALGNKINKTVVRNSSVVLNTSGYADGIYYFKVFSENEQVNSGSFMVAH